jgi:AbiV family abortive infection protein
MDKRRFRNNTDQVVTAVQACLRNSVELRKAASEQIDAKRPGLAVSLIVLALEELGKLLLADGLAFAEPGDERAKRFEEALRKHKTKLEVLDLFPFSVPYFARFDPRFETEERFRQAIAMSLQGTKATREELARWLGPGWSFEVLDQWKQKGFYVHLADGVTLKTPNDAIDPEFAGKLVSFGNVLINFVDFPLRNNFSRYRKMLEGVRSHWSEEGYRHIQSVVKDGLDQMFGTPSDTSD